MSQTWEKLWDSWNLTERINAQKELINPTEGTFFQFIYKKFDNKKSHKNIPKVFIISTYNFIFTCQY